MKKVQFITFEYVIPSLYYFFRSLGTSYFFTNEKLPFNKAT